MNLGPKSIVPSTSCRATAQSDDPQSIICTRVFTFELNETSLKIYFHRKFDRITFFV